MARQLGLLIVMVVVASLGRADAKPLRLVTYRGTNYTIDVPKGWSVKVDEAAGVLGATQDPRDKASPALMILTSAVAHDVTPEVITAAIAQKLGGERIRIVREEPIDSGRIALADGVLDGNAVRVGIVVVVKNGAAVVAALVTPKAKFERLGGIATIRAVLQSYRATTADATPPRAPARVASTAAIPAGVYVGVTPRTVTGRYGATMELALVWYTFGPEGWFQHWFGPPDGLAIERRDDALAYEVKGNRFRYVSRGKAYERKFARLSNGRIKLDSMELTKVDLGYDGLALDGTYEANTVARALQRGATTTGGATTAASTITKVFRTDGTVEEHRATGVDSVHGSTGVERRRRGRYAIARNRITLRWDDGTTDTHTFSTWGGPRHLLIHKHLYTRK